MFKVLSEWHARHNLISSEETALAAAAYMGNIMQIINKKIDRIFLLYINPPVKLVEIL